MLSSALARSMSARPSSLRLAATTVPRVAAGVNRVSIPNAKFSTTVTRMSRAFAALASNSEFAVPCSEIPKKFNLASGLLLSGAMLGGTAMMMIPKDEMKRDAVNFSPFSLSMLSTTNVCLCEEAEAETAECASCEEQTAETVECESCCSNGETTVVSDEEKIPVLTGSSEAFRARYER